MGGWLSSGSPPAHAGPLRAALDSQSNEAVSRHAQMTETQTKEPNKADASWTGLEHYRSRSSSPDSHEASRRQGNITSRQGTDRARPLVQCIEIPESARTTDVRHIDALSETCRRYKGPTRPYDLLLRLLADLSVARAASQCHRKDLMSSLEVLFEPLTDSSRQDQLQARLQYADNAWLRVQKAEAFLEKAEKDTTIQESSLIQYLEKTSSHSPDDVVSLVSENESDAVSGRQHEALGSIDDDDMLVALLSYKEESQLEDELLEIGRRQDAIMTDALQEAGSSELDPEALQALDELDAEREVIMSRLVKARRRREEDSKAFGSPPRPEVLSSSIKSEEDMD